MKMVRGYLHIPHKHAEGDSVTTVPHSAGRLPTRKFPACTDYYTSTYRGKKKLWGKETVVIFPIRLHWLYGYIELYESCSVSLECGKVIYAQVKEMFIRYGLGKCGEGID